MHTIKSQRIFHLFSGSERGHEKGREMEWREGDIYKFKPMYCVVVPHTLGALTLKRSAAARCGEGAA